MAEGGFGVARDVAGSGIGVARDVAGSALTQFLSLRATNGDSIDDVGGCARRTAGRTRGRRSARTRAGTRIRAVTRAGTRTRASGRHPAGAARRRVEGRRARGEALPIPDYDELSASQVVERLEGLDHDSLDAIRRYETDHRGRNTILGKIAQLS